MSTEMLQKYAFSLFEDQLVECVIGYHLGPRGATRPVFIRSQEEVEQLVWNQDCSHNLTVYLKQHLSQTEGRVGVVVKPCDSKTINVLLAENRIDRERVHIIGIACEGMLDRHTGNGKETGQLQERCEICQLTEPITADHVIGESGERSDTLEQELQSAWLDNATTEERLSFWAGQFDRCIRCYACRQACPMCDCPTCLFEREDSLWVGNMAGVKQNRSFHIGRAFHLAGRCVGCNECERVCPMDIRISLLNQCLAREMEIRFQHRAGFKTELSPITTTLGERD
jgi:coenzyme F420-reducing hydrogenase beta subunit